MLQLLRHPLFSKFPCRSFVRGIYQYYSRRGGDSSLKKKIADCLPLVAQKVGLEIGGPSALFARMGLFPIYPFVKQLDNCNFANHTTWEKSLSEGMNFHYDDDHSPGYQFIREGTDLHGIEVDAYDFVLSSHNIEHIANPLRALQEWRRVLKDSGAIILVVPHLDGTFDHNRPVTSLRHIVEDFQNDICEDDLTHLPEILALHDLERDPLAGNFENFKKRSERNQENRCLHHHVFDTALALAVMNYAGLQIRSVQLELPYHIFVVGEVLPAGQRIDNSKFLAPNASYRLCSPFPTDCLNGHGGPSPCPD